MKRYGVVRDRILGGWQWECGPKTLLGAIWRRLCNPESLHITPWMGNADATMDAYVRRCIVESAPPNAVLPDGWRQQHNGE